MNSKTISKVMSELARRSNKNLTTAQRDARRENMKKARAAKEEKRVISNYLDEVEARPPSPPCDGSCQGFCDDHHDLSLEI